MILSSLIFMSISWGATLSLLTFCIVKLNSNEIEKL